MVLASIIDKHRRSIGFRRAVLQVLIEEWLKHIAAELQRRVAVPLQWPQGRTIIVDSAVAPRPHYKKIHIIADVLWLHCQVAVDRAPHVFLVPQALNPHRRYL